MLVPEISPLTTEIAFNELNMRYCCTCNLTAYILCSSRDNPVFNSEQAELDSDVNQKYRPSLSGQPSIAGSPAGSFFALDACSHPGAPRPPTHAASMKWINEVDSILAEISRLGVANPGPGLNQLQPRTSQIFAVLALRKVRGMLHSAPTWLCGLVIDGKSACHSLAKRK